MGRNLNVIVCQEKAVIINKALVINYVGKRRFLDWER